MERGGGDEWSSGIGLMEAVTEEARLGYTCEEKKGLAERQWGVEVGAQACWL